MKVHRIAAFTDDGTGGNPAGVVIADAPLEVETMQRVAAEVGYSETVFATPSGDRWLTRYFSPESEVPFCGHATIALGAVLAAEHGAGHYRLALVDGEIEVEARFEAGLGYSTLRSLPTRNMAAPNLLVEEALTVFGYEPGSLDDTLPPRRMNAGAEHLFLALKSRELLSAMQYRLDEGRTFMRRHGFVTVMFVWRESPELFHVRNAFASGGVMEDPATGAAAAALAGMLRDNRILEPGELTVLQGVDMGSPSRLLVRYDNPAGSPVFVCGASATIA